MSKDLFDEYVAYARRTDPETSHEAARSMDTQVTRIEAAVYSVIKLSYHGLICDQIVEITGLNWNTVSPRLRPLLNKGLIENRCIEGKPIKRAGKSGRAQLVWYAKI